MKVSLIDMCFIGKINKHPSYITCYNCGMMIERNRHNDNECKIGEAYTEEIKKIDGAFLNGPFEYYQDMRLFDLEEMIKYIPDAYKEKVYVYIIEKRLKNK